MTTFYADIASYQAGLNLSGLQAVCVKATEATNYVDPEYASWKTQAETLGILFSAYHYLHADNVAAQAVFCYSVVGKTPLMLDVEATGTVDSVSTITQFISAFTALGGRVWGFYLPEWYWSSNMGSPDLSGVPGALVSSNYSQPYSDTGVGWNPYGGKTPAIWQVSQSHTYQGQPVDWDAFKGSLDELKALWYGTPVPDPVPTPTPTIPLEVLDMAEQSRADGSVDVPIAEHPARNHVIIIDPDQFPVTLRVVQWNSPGESPLVTDYEFPGADYTIHLENDPNCLGLTVTANKPVRYAIGPVYS